MDEEKKLGYTTDDGTKPDPDPFPDNPSTGTGDPHIVTFRGDRFDFMGEPGRWYNFVSTRSLQVNVLMGQYMGHLTYIAEAGVQVQTPDRREVHALAYMDGNLLRLRGEHADCVQMRYTPRKILEATGQALRVKLTRGRELYEGVIVPHINIGAGICKGGALCEGVTPHGVMGQFATRLRGVPRTSNCKQGEGFIDGHYTDYEVSGPFCTLFRFNQYGVEPQFEPVFGIRQKCRSIALL